MSCCSPSAPAIAERAPAAPGGEPAAAEAPDSPERPGTAEGPVTAGAGATGPNRPADSLGQGLVEYGLILILIAVVAIIALVFFGDALAAGLNFIGQIIDSAH